MQTKIILAITTLAIVSAALIGVSVAQLVGAQTQNATTPQLIQLPNGQYVYDVPTSNGTLVYPCNPYLANQNSVQTPQAPAPNGYGYEYGRGGMCGRFW